MGGSATSARIRLDSLTGLRFIAALLVVLYHTSVQLLPELHPVVSMGQTGVTFFFILSGFVLAWSMNPQTSKRQFYWRRFARVWPLHALTMGMAVILLQATQSDQSVPKFLASLALVQSWPPDTTWAYAYNGVSWSLSCEAFFYAVFPVLAVWISRFKHHQVLRIAVIAFGVAAGSLTVLLMFVPRFDWGAVFYTFPAYRVAEFVVGVCLAVAMRKGWTPRFGIRMGALGAVGSIAVLEVVAANVPWHIAPALASTLCVPGFATLIAAYAQRDLSGRRSFASTNVMVRLGEWSFALYLIHELLLRSFAALGPGSFNDRFLLALFAVTGSILLSGALYALFERPVESWLRGMFVSRKATAGSKVLERASDTGAR